jgi:hypothetical protein
MARRRVSDREQKRLVDEVEALRETGDGWDFAHPRQVNRGSNPTAVVSTRLPIVQFRRLSKMAAAERRTVAELMKDALEAYIAVSPFITLNQETRRLRVYGVRPGTESLQPEAQRFVEEDGTSTDHQAIA